MSRSRKKKPVVRFSMAESEKPYKRQEHGRERAAVRNALRRGAEPPSRRSYGDPALGPKDGKTYAPECAVARRK